MNTRRCREGGRSLCGLMLCGLMLFSDGRAEENVVDGEPVVDDSMSARVDRSREMVSRSLDAFAHKIDAFFDDERFVAEDATTRLRVGQFIFAQEGDDLRWRTRLNLSFRLPNLNHRVKLFYSGDEDDTAAAATDTTLRDSIESRSNESLAGFRYYSKATKRLNLSTAVGVKVSGGNLFAGPRLRYSQDLGDWLGRFTERLIYITDRGWESTTRVDLDRALSSRMLLRNTVEGRWREEDPGYRIELGPTLYHQLPESIVMAYSWMHLFKTRPQHTYERSVMSVQFRRHIWRNWLYLEIAPQLAFYEDDNFNPTAGISLGLELILGSK